MSETAGNVLFVVRISLVAALGGFLFGYDSGVINGTIDGLQTAFDTDAIGTGFSVASMLLGCAVGALVAGRLSDIYGRRATMVIAAVFFIISALGSGISNGVTEFVLYRMLGGLAVGAASILAPAYISEIAPASIRGRLSGLQQIMIIIGLTAAFLSNYFLAQSAGLSTSQFWLGYEAWRWMFWMEIIPASVFFLALFTIPETPRFLVSADRITQAQAVLTKISGAAQASGKVTEIKQSLASDHRPRLSDLIGENGAVRSIVWIGIGLAVFQQLVGINVVFYYGAVLWQSVGFTEADALKINILSGSLSILSCLIGLAIIDRIGRKPLLLIGSVGMAATLGLMAFAFAQGSLDNAGDLQLSDNMGTLGLVSANIYVALFNFSWGPVMWVMLGEMFPNQIRGSGLGVSGVAQWLANFGITMTFPVFLAGIGLAGAYGLYAMAALISVFFVWFLLHETKGRELEEMEG